jgi:uncharacterized membrane protein
MPKSPAPESGAPNAPSAAGLETDNSDLIAQNVSAVRRLRLEAERKHGALHQPIERVFAALAKPTAIYTLVAVIVAWTALNLALLVFHRAPLDAPPFFALDSVLAVLSLLTTIVVLIVQARQGKLADERAELQLQVNLLSEQKIAKLIELVEALRRDSPFLENVDDAQVEAMKRGSDPEAILRALEQSEAALDATKPPE